MGTTKQFNFSDVNWEVERDTDIANRKGCSRELVRQKREKSGIECKYKRKDKKLLKWIEDNIHLSGEMTAREAEEASGYSYNCLSRNGFWDNSKVKRARELVRPWEEMNFDLPNKVLSEIWNLIDPPSMRVRGRGHRIALIRHSLGKGASRWDLRFGHIKEEWFLDNDKEYIKAIEEEKEKFIKWSKKQIEDTEKKLEEDKEELEQRISLDREELVLL